jgi:hypothetical protein
MNALTLQVPDEMLKKIESAAEARQQPVDTFILDVMAGALRELEAEARFLVRAKRGRGREQEALELLRR